MNTILKDKELYYRTDEYCEELKKIIAHIWKYDLTETDLEEIGDLENFKKNYYEQQEFIKRKTGRTIPS